MFNTQVYEVEEYQRSNNLSELGSNSEFDDYLADQLSDFYQIAMN